MQTVGHLVTQDGEKGGIVTAVGSARVGQPDLVTRNVVTGEEVSRQSQEPLDVQTVDVAWEDGTTSQLCEVVDSWSVLGSVVTYPKPEDDPVGSVEGTDVHKAAVAEAVADVAGYFEQVRQARSLYDAAVDAGVQTAVEEDPTYVRQLVDGNGTTEQTVTRVEPS